MSLSDVYEVKVLNALLRGTALSAVANVYVAVTATAITDADTGTTLAAKEPVDPVYARVQVACTTAQFSLPSTTAGQSLNVNPITFATATQDWLSLNPIAYFALVDSAVNGAIVLYGTLSQTRVVENGDVFEIPANTLTVTAD